MQSFAEPSTMPGSQMYYARYAVMSKAIVAVNDVVHRSADMESRRETPDWGWQQTPHAECLCKLTEPCQGFLSTSSG